MSDELETLLNEAFGLEAETESAEADTPSAGEAELPTTTEITDTSTSDDVSVPSEDFDWTPHANAKITLKVAGEPVTLTLKEALDGAMRQQDYTRKTQELAGHRQAAESWTQLQQAFQTNPEGTLRQLADAFGLQFGAPADTVDPYEGLDPEFQPFIESQRALEAQLAEQQRIIDAISQERIAAEIRGEIDTLTRTHGEFDVSAVARLAVDNGITLSMAHKIYQAEKLIAEAANRAQAEATAAEAARVAADKARQASTVTKGTGVRGGDAIPADMDFEQLFAHFANA